MSPTVAHSTNMCFVRQVIVLHRRWTSDEVPRGWVTAWVTCRATTMVQASESPGRRSMTWRQRSGFRRHAPLRPARGDRRRHVVVPHRSVHHCAAHNSDYVAAQRLRGAARPASPTPSRSPITECLHSAVPILGVAVLSASEPAVEGTSARLSESWLGPSQGVSPSFRCVSSGLRAGIAGILRR